MYFHGTTPDLADKILTEGFDLAAPRLSDPGDFGWGVYLTDHIERARGYGKGLLRVTVDTQQFAVVGTFPRDPDYGGNGSPSWEARVLENQAEARGRKAKAVAETKRLNKQWAADGYPVPEGAL